MAISQEKLKSWALQGATVTAKSTHESVRNALKSSDELKRINFEVYLQGSYKNSTNIRGESDVDIVVQLNSIFNKDISKLSINEKNLCNSEFKNATYSLSKFKNSVIEALNEYFGSSVISEGDKCIKVNKNSNRLDADVVVCNQYRKYKKFINRDNQKFDEGIIFYSKSGHTIISYPKIHFDNGSIKNSEYRTNGWYKPTVRLFKNARSHLIRNGVIDRDVAPSFFVECLLYNAPDKFFKSNHSDTFVNLINWFGKSLSNGKYQNFLCQDGQLKLFGNSSEQWDKDKAMNLIVNLSKLWEDW